MRLITKEIIWEIRVARPTPRTPIPNPTTNSRSSTTFTMLAMIRKYRLVLESPMARRMAAMPLYRATATVPRQIRRR